MLYGKPIIIFFGLALILLNTVVYFKNITYRTEVEVKSWNLATTVKFYNDGRKEYNGYYGKIKFIRDKNKECEEKIEFPDEKIKTFDVSLFMNDLYKKGTKVNVYTKIFDNSCSIEEPKPISYIFVSICVLIMFLIAYWLDQYCNAFDPHYPIYYLMEMDP